MKPTKETIHSAVIDALKSVFDPEIPVNIYDLGFIYNIEVTDEMKVKIAESSAYRVFPTPKWR